LMQLRIPNQVSTDTYILGNIYSDVEALSSYFSLIMKNQKLIYFCKLQYKKPLNKILCQTHKMQPK